MNRDNIIRMARDAGLLPLLDEDCFQTMGTKNFGATKKVLERFAALAAAANAECATKTMPFPPAFQNEEIEEMSKDTSGPAFPADIPRIDTVKSLSPAPVTLDAIRKIVREELRANAALEAAARQALEALEKGATVSAAIILRAALAQPSPATLIDPRGSLGEPIV